MDRSRNEFREQLIGAERLTPAYRERYERQVGEMVQQRLTGPSKWGYLGMGVLCLGLAVTFSTAAVIAPKEFPLLGRIGFIAGAVFGLGFAGYMLTLVRRGSVNLKSDPMAMAGMAWGLVVIMMTIALLTRGDVGDSMVLRGLPFVLYAALCLITARMQQAEVRMQERLLEIEYHLAELAEEVSANRRDGGTAPADSSRGG